MEQERDGLAAHIIVHTTRTAVEAQTSQNTLKLTAKYKKKKYLNSTRNLHCLQYHTAGTARSKKGHQKTQARQQGDIDRVKEIGRRAVNSPIAEEAKDI